MKAIIFDIYGTLLRQEIGDLEESLSKEQKLLRSFSRLKRKYKLKATSKKLFNLFVDSIGKVHNLKKSRGIKHPEVKIEKIWGMILRKIGYKFNNKFLFRIAYDHHELTGRRVLYPDVASTLMKIKQSGIKLGIISNAQFYTEIDMFNLLKKEIRVKSLYELFDKQLVFYSYKVGCSKPNIKSFLLLKEKLKKLGIKSSEALYIGNDMLKDIKTAKKAGFRTCLFVNVETKYKGVKLRPDCRIRDIKSILRII